MNNENTQDDKMTSFLDSADSRETSTEIMEAIALVAKSDADEAERIWEDPTLEQLTQVWQIVTHGGEIESTEFCWGTSGRAWFNFYLTCISIRSDVKIDATKKGIAP